jgi:hypothetical protein
MLSSPFSASVLSSSEELQSFKSFNSSLEIRRFEQSAAVERSKAIERFEQHTLAPLPRLQRARA